MPQSNPYCGPAPIPEGIFLAWNTDPVLLTALAFLLVAGGALAQARGIFLLGWAGLVLAFVSPLCALTVALFSARTLHHLILIGWVAPALALALPLRLPTIPAATGFTLTAAALIAWHLPPIYAAAWTSSTVYWLMQAALILPAWAFWARVIPAGTESGDGLISSALLVGALAGVMGLIGAVLTFAARVLYPEHLSGPLAWGIQPLADQQLAGLVMWVPGLVPLALVAGLLARRAWLRVQPI